MIAGVDDFDSHFSVYAGDARGFVFYDAFDKFFVFFFVRVNEQGAPGFHKGRHNAGVFIADDHFIFSQAADKQDAFCPENLDSGIVGRNAPRPRRL